MALAAIDSPGQWFDVCRLNGSHSGVSFLREGNILYCRLPSGRLLHYHSIEKTPGPRGWEMSYEGWNTNPTNGPYGWIRMSTWGGRLVENIVQATCRDILRRAILRLEAAGYPVVLHVYDEIVSEVLESFGSIEEFEQIVTAPIEWCADWPLRAPGGYRAKRYRKGE
jgi:DNA polymerase